VVDASAAALDALRLRILDLVGDFEKPVYVRYDPFTCAGGASGHQACGRCVIACPYEAVSRKPDEPLRVAVDHAACEGCGSCVAACPTSSLTFTDPPTAVLPPRLRRDHAEILRERTLERTRTGMGIRARPGAGRHPDA
jgi:ferredoxin